MRTCVVLGGERREPLAGPVGRAVVDEDTSYSPAGSDWPSSESSSGSMRSPGLNTGTMTETLSIAAGHDRGRWRSGGATSWSPAAASAASPRRSPRPPAGAPSCCRSRPTGSAGSSRARPSRPTSTAGSSAAAARRLPRLRDGIRAHYRAHCPLTERARLLPELNPGACTVSRLGARAAVALAVLHALLAPALADGRLTVLLRHRPVRADVDRRPRRRGDARGARTARSRSRRTASSTRPRPARCCPRAGPST